MADRQARTLLEQRMRERCLTFEEFVQYAETFARDHQEPGTLSLRHLQRLVSGQHLGALRPATARLLERIFGEPITALLAPPKTAITSEGDNPASELRQLLDTTRRIDHSTIMLLHQQLDVLRRLDRQLGAVVVHDELNATIRHVQELATYSLAPGTREPLAALLSEMHHLAGWQALDLGNIAEAWQHYGCSRSTAEQSNSVPHTSHAAAGQAIVLREAGATGDAVDLLDSTRRQAQLASPPVLRSWLAATHGETLAAHGDRTASLRAFDKAAELLPCDATDERPYIALDGVHLARWRGQALAYFGEPDAVPVLTDALNRLDSSSNARAEARTRIALATALAANGNRDDARAHANHATQLAAQVGSARLRRRSTTLLL